VVRVRRHQGQKRGRGMRGIADRNMQFMAVTTPRDGLPQLPPELMPMTVTSIAASGLRAFLDGGMTRAVAAKRISTMSTGITVHAVSI